MMRTPSPDQMRRAADWLRSYEDAPDEDTSNELEVVAAWLLSKASEKEIRDIARRGGVGVKLLRERLAAQSDSN